MEQDIDLQNVRTNISTIIYLERPNDEQLLSQQLIELTGDKIAENQKKKVELQQLRNRLFSKSDVHCIAKVVPSKLRDHETLIFEVMLPGDLEQPENMEKACQIVGPLLVLSQ